MHQQLFLSNYIPFNQIIILLSQVELNNSFPVLRIIDIENFPAFILLLLFRVFSLSFQLPGSPLLTVMWQQPASHKHTFEGIYDI